MKKLFTLTLATLAFGVLAPTEAKADHDRGFRGSDRVFAGYNCDGYPTYRERRIVGYHDCGEPIYRWVTTVERPRCGTGRDYGHGHRSHRSSRGVSIRTPGFSFSFGR
jgi:hypothetical protein